MGPMDETLTDLQTGGWNFGEDVDKFQYYTQKLIDLWPEKAAVSAAVGSVCSFFYCDIVLVWLWLIAIIGDFASGIAVGWHQKHELCCVKLRHGVTKLLVYIVYTMIAAVAGVAINRACGFEIPFLNLFLAYMTITELKSILKNMSIIGFKTPPLIDAFLKRSSSRIENVVEPEERRGRMPGGIPEGFGSYGSKEVRDYTAKRSREDYGQERIER